MYIEHVALKLPHSRRTTFLTDSWRTDLAQMSLVARLASLMAVALTTATADETYLPQCKHIGEKHDADGIGGCSKAGEGDSTEIVLLQYVPDRRSLLSTRSAGRINQSVSCQSKVGGKWFSCSAFNYCCAGLSCHPFYQVCYHKPRQLHEPCMAGYDCGPGLSCAPGSQKCYHKPRQLHEPCSLGFDCGPGLSCQAGEQKCYHNPRQVGEPCNWTPLGGKDECDKAVTAERPLGLCCLPPLFNSKCGVKKIVDEWNTSNCWTEP